MKKLVCAIFLLTIIVCSNTYAQVDLQSGLMLFYPLNGNSNDLSGNGMDGTIHGNPQLATDRFGTNGAALLFDGVNDFISMPTSTITTSSYSYSVWVNPQSITGVHSIISIGTSDGTTTNDQDILVSFSEGWIGGAFKNNGGFFTISTGSVPALNNWYHLVLTRDNSKVQFFINGVFLGSGAVANESPDYGTAPTANLAKRSGVNAQFFNGAMDDVRIYNRVLKNDEVTALFQSLQVLSIFNSNSNHHIIGVSPNPSNGNFKLDLPSTFYRCEILIQNSVGQTVYSGTFESMSNGTEINALNAPNGVYLLTVKSEVGVETERIIIQ